jgi:hypothetical protein
LPRVWAHGDVVALLWSVSFAVLLNFAIVVAFVWPELVSPAVRVALWWGLAGIWLASLVWSIRRLRIEPAGPHQASDLDALFVRAQQECLRGDWYPAEASLRKLIRAHAGDVDGRLMLATLLRHTGRTDEARRELKQLERLESAEKWRLEIRQEYERLDATTTSTDDESPDSAEEDDDVDVVTVATDDTLPSAGASEAA